ncbi:hypothetical protein GCM10011415_07050 [Salipiger pallidus]|uniref:Uncharacterized protein n=1 Tax=Salipiger pallidus TaxID=1775170 RepID=A0A8J2ZHI7_9RHOB|nr:hypothetical protein GCM10011415_07050 [Salipiger pallidus]
MLVYGAMSDPGVVAHIVSQCGRFSYSLERRGAELDMRRLRSQPANVHLVFTDLTD